MLKPAWTLRTLRRKLSSAGLPKWWVTKCCEAAKKVQGLSLVVGLEVFAGKAELSQAFIDYVGDFLSFDIKIDAKHDLQFEGGLGIMLEFSSVLHKVNVTMVFS